MSIYMTYKTPCKEGIYGETKENGQGHDDFVKRIRKGAGKESRE